MTLSRWSATTGYYLPALRAALRLRTKIKKANPEVGLFVAYDRGGRLELKSPAVFARDDERLDHVGVGESVVMVAGRLVQLGKPEIVAGIVRVTVTIVGIAPEVAEEMLPHERPLEFMVAQGRGF